ncbi:helix-turn-helix transcriptional regulator [Glutamicibacter sp.]
MIAMAMTLKDFLDEHPVDRARVEAHKERMLAEVRAYRLRELREQAGFTQAQLAERIGVGQRQVSKIERGDLDSTKIGTIRSYLEAVGGGLAIEYVMGDQRVQVA